MALLPVLMKFAEGLLVFGGDLKFANRLLEVSHGSSHLPYSRLKCLKTDLHLLGLVDAPPRT